MGELIYIPDPHSYAHDGKPIPGLTSIMVAEGYIKGAWYTEAGRERGTDVHRGCEDYDRGGQDWLRLPADQIPYVEAWAQYCEYYKFKPKRIEQPAHSHIYKFATTPDAVGSDNEYELVIVERKTGTKENWWPIQTAGQAIAILEELWLQDSSTVPLVSRRLVVQLMPNGKYKPHFHKNKEGYDVAKAMFLIHHDKHNRGIL